LTEQFTGTTTYLTERLETLTHFLSTSMTKPKRIYERAILMMTRSKQSGNWFLLALGLIALAFSVIYASSILTFIGLGLAFWGALLVYIPSECMCASCLELKFGCARSSVGIFICPATKMYYT